MADPEPEIKNLPPHIPPISIIFPDEVDDVADEASTATANQSDFADYDIKSAIKEEEEPEPEEETEEEEAERVEAEEMEDEYSHLSPDQRKQINDIKKDIVQSLMDSDTIIAIFDLIVSRSGSLIPGTERSDWKLDAEEKEIFSKILEGTIEEENIQYMPMKYWFFLAFFFIYGFKTMEAAAKWDAHNDQKDLKATDTAKEIQTASAEAEIILQAQVDAAKKLYDLKRQLAMYESGINGANAEPQIEGYYYNTDGSPMLNKDGTHRKKPGRGSTNYPDSTQPDEETEEVTETEEVEPE